MMNKKFFLNSIQMITFWGIMGIFLFPGTGYASAFTNALNTLYTTFTEARIVVYVCAGFGLIGVAVAAISGKLPWKWFSMIAVALFTLAAAEKIVQYSTGVGTGTNTVSNFGSALRSSEFDISDAANSSINDNQFNYNNFSRNKEDTSFRSSISR